MSKWISNLLIILGAGLLALSLTNAGKRGEWRPNSGGAAVAVMMIVGGMLWKRER